MKAGRIWPLVIIAAVLVLLFAFALWLRVWLPYAKVFTPDEIVFTGNDAYYHMRLAQILADNFPHFPVIDPYLMYAGSPGHLTPSFFQWLIGTVAWIVGLGSPSQHTLDTVGAYFPAVLGALTVVPVYFIAQTLWGRHGKWAGLVAAGLVAVLPGEFLGRSFLGFTDQHVAETLLSTTSILFLILAVKSARVAELTFSHIRKMDWKRLWLPVLFALLSGIFLGLYIFAWQGALLLVFIMAAYFVIQFVIDHLKHRASDYLLVVGVTLFVISLLFIPVSPTGLFPPSLLIATLIVPVLWGTSRVMANRRISRGFYPLALGVIGLAGLGLFYLVSPSLVRSMLDAFKIFTPSGTLLATTEAQSIFTSQVASGGFIDKFTSSPAWTNFYFTLPIALLTLAVVIVRDVFIKRNPEKCVFIVWNTVMLVALIGQRRFGYYFIVNAALLAGYASMLIYYFIAWAIPRAGGDKTRFFTEAALDLDGLKLKKAAAEPVTSPITKKARRRARQESRKRELERRRLVREQAGSGIVIRDYVASGLSIIVIFMLLFSQAILLPADSKLYSINQSEPWYKNTPSAIALKTTPYAPSDAWQQSLMWMRDNTPEPLGNTEAYYKQYRQGFTYPPSAYGVIAWWDYGYWITYIAHRIPIANPGQDPTAVKKVAAFFTARDEDTAEAVANEVDSAYVVMDYETASTKFWAVATWAGLQPRDYMDVYYVTQNDQLVPVQLYYPEYYQSISTRLYNFDGKATTADNVTVIAYEDTLVDNGRLTIKRITDVQQFDSYEKAETFIQSQGDTKHRIVGIDPTVSPVPFEALQHYRLVYSSMNTVTISSGKQTPEIKIFERID